MNQTGAPDWAAIKADYDAGALGVGAIAKRHQVSKWQIYAEAKRAGWVLRCRTKAAKARPAQPTGRRALIGRLMRMLERHIEFMEINMTGSDEKEVTLLGNVARTLEKLMDLDRKDEGQKPNAKRSREIDDLRQKLAARIDQLRKG